MSTIIKFDLKQLRKLVKDTNSCVIEKKVMQNMAMQPWCLGNLKESITNLLDYKIGKFDKEFNGIVLSYKNLRILQNVGTIRNDNADIHFQVEADYFIFQPFVGATLTGVVIKKSNTHLGILVHRVFNVVIPQPTEEPGNKWVGSSVREGQEVTFRIVVLDLFGALPYIRGELDERSVKLLPEGDDDDVEIEPDLPINVSYVDFDKAKAHNIQKQDGLSPISKNNTKTTNCSNNEHETENDSGPSDTHKLENENGITDRHTDKNNIRKRKLSEPAQKESNSNHSPKKIYKKD